MNQAYTMSIVLMLCLTTVSTGSLDEPEVTRINDNPNGFRPLLWQDPHRFLSFPQILNLKTSKIRQSRHLNGLERKLRL